MTAALGLGEAAESGRQAAFNALTNRTAGAGADSEAGSSSMPGWARAMKAQQTTRHHGQAAMHAVQQGDRGGHGRSEEHTSELQSLMRISYAVFCLKKKKKTH